MESNLTFLCIATHFNGNDFLKGCKEAGNNVLLLTSRHLEKSAWEFDHIDEMLFLDDQTPFAHQADRVVKDLAYVFRTLRIDRVVALNDRDVEKAAYIREQFRIPGMGTTTAGYFRDKLAMRIKAAQSGIRVPGFCSLFHDAEINTFIETSPGPWMLKPRTEASVTGIIKSNTAKELWKTIDDLGDKRHEYLVEQYKQGDVFHVNSLSVDSKVIFSWSGIYLSPPFDVSSKGGVFRSVSLPFGSPEQHALETLSVDVLKAFGLRHSVSHTEVIRSADDGHYYFLETSCRVPETHLSDLVEASSGLNLWKEWARLETADALGLPYLLPPLTKKNAGIIISALPSPEVAQETPFQADEVTSLIEDESRAGCIVQSPDRSRILQLLEEYTGLIEKYTRV